MRSRSWSEEIRRVRSSKGQASILPRPRKQAEKDRQVYCLSNKSGATVKVQLLDRQSLMREFLNVGEQYYLAVESEVIVHEMGHSVQPAFPHPYLPKLMRLAGRRRLH